MKRLSDKHLACSLLFLILTVFIFIVFHTDNYFGGTDNYSHFKLAYWGWKYPGMLFDHWGKPVFTILASPFAQFGIKGVRIYNIIMGLATACLVWIIARQFNFRHAWIVILLIVFMPVYFVLMFTSLTEVTFSFFITLAIFMFFKEKYIWSAVILSFLPLARTEGIVILPLFIIAYILKKEYRALPFLITGFLAFSLAGRPFHDSFLWLITDMPYTGSAKDIYGTGDLFHFVAQSPNIFGLLPGIFFIAGILVMLYRWNKKSHFKTDNTFYFLLLVTGSFLVFFAAHSFAWWKGIGNSLGLVRVIGSVTPLAALTAMAGVSVFFEINKKQWRTVIAVLMAIAFFFFINDSIQREKKYFQSDPAQLLLNKAADYIINNDLTHHKIVYYDPYLAYRLKLDPKDPAKSRERLFSGDDYIEREPDSTIIIWDAHFGPNEGKMPLKKLESEQKLKILQVFKPDKPTQTLGGHEYKIVIFMKQ